MCVGMVGGGVAKGSRNPDSSEFINGLAVQTACKVVFSQGEYCN